MVPGTFQVQGYFVHGIHVCVFMCTVVLKHLLLFLLKSLLLFVLLNDVLLGVIYCLLILS